MMRRNKIPIPLLLLALVSVTAQADMWINEIHYDNTGADVNQFIEVVITNDSSVAPPDLGTISLELYDSATGTTYDQVLLTDAAIQVTTTAFANFYLWEPVDIQNGAGDAVALNQGIFPMQFLSWEGTMTATGGFAAGFTSTDIGVSQTDAPLGRSIGLIGNGTTYNEFTWSGDMPFTQGAINQGQSFGMTVPEPSSMLLWLAGSVALIAKRRRHA